MEAWHLWIIVGFMLALAELLGLGFFALALGLACLAGAAAAFFVASTSVQLLAFAITAAIIAPAITHVLRKSGQSKRRSTLAGESGSQTGVLVNAPGGEMRIKVEGDVYPVRCLSGRVLKEGETVIVERFDGITALIN